MRQKNKKHSIGKDYFTCVVRVNIFALSIVHVWGGDRWKNEFWIKEKKQGNYGCIMSRGWILGLGIEIGRLKRGLIILVPYSWGLLGGARHIRVIIHRDPQLSVAITSPDNHNFSNWIRQICWFEFFNWNQTWKRWILNQNLKLFSHLSVKLADERGGGLLIKLTDEPDQLLRINIYHIIQLQLVK